MQDREKELIGRNLSFQGHQLIVPIMDPDEDLWKFTELPKMITAYQARLDFYERKAYLPLGKISFADIIRLAETIILYQEVCPGWWQST